MKRIIPTAIFTVLLAGCSHGIIRPKVEGGIRDALPEYIGPAKEYTVKADGPSMQMLKGDIERLHIQGADVQVAPNLTVNQLAVDMEEVEFIPETRQLKSAQRTTFEARVSEQAVNRYMNAAREDKADKLDVGEPRIDLDSGKITVITRPSVYGLGAEVRITGRPVIEGGTKVNFVADSASLARLPLPVSIVNKLLQRTNPVLDMSAMRFPVSLTSVTIKKGFIIIKGNAEVGLAKSP